MSPVVLALLIFLGVLIALLVALTAVLKLGAPKQQVRS